MKAFLKEKCPSFNYNIISAKLQNLYKEGAQFCKIIFLTKLPLCYYIHCDVKLRYIVINMSVVAILLNVSHSREVNIDTVQRKTYYCQKHCNSTIFFYKKKNIIFCQSGQKPKVACAVFTFDYLL